MTSQLMSKSLRTWIVALSVHFESETMPTDVSAVAQQ